MSLETIIQQANPGHSWHEPARLIATAAYMIVAGFCFFSWRRARRDSVPSAVLWAIFAGVHLFLAADTLLSLRLIIAEAGREYSQTHGWYSHRRPLQALLSVACAGVLLLVALGSRRYLHHLPKGCWLALAGTALALLHFSLAAVSWHTVEDLMDWPRQAFSLGRAAHVMSWALTIWGAAVFLRTSPIPVEDRASQGRG